MTAKILERRTNNTVEMKRQIVGDRVQNQAKNDWAK